MIPPPTTDAAIDVPEPLRRAAIAITLLVAGVVGARSGLASITLAENGVSEHRIVIPVEATAVERVAADRLAYYLEGITGAELPILEASEFDGLGPAIFVGLSEPALDRLGDDPLAGLGPQQHVARSIGEDILLYGVGVHGSYHAAMDFAEVSLGRRWYTPYEAPVLPDTPTVVLEPFERIGGFDFAHRRVQLSSDLRFYYEHGINMGITPRAEAIGVGDLGYESEIDDTLNLPHSFGGLVPANGLPNYAANWDWIPRADYFSTNPEWFTLNEQGTRVSNRQLCLSNHELRAELTQNLLGGIASVGERCVVSVSANDTPGRLCHCGPCNALMEQYQSPGGPLYDYLLELCGELETTHPEVRVASLAYRRDQTQIPPTLPAGATLPSNLVIDFAPIEDSYFADWSHPDPEIQETYAHLQAWGRIAAPGNLWAWLYPNPWGTGISMPVGNVERLATNLRLMHEAGVDGVFTDHAGYTARSGWSEVQAYLFYALCKDVDADVDAILEEVTDALYGPAAPAMRAFLEALEAGRLAMAELPPGVGYKSREFDELTFPYLTAERLHEWQGLFDAMLEAIDGGPEAVTRNVRLARRELDLATLWRWFDLVELHPDIYTDHTVVVDRLTSINDTPGVVAIGEADLEYFTTIILGGGGEQPLPDAFDGIARSRIRTFVPYRHRGWPRVVLDPEAARGYAAVVDSPDLPFSVGGHQFDTGLRVADVNLAPGDVEAGVYELVSLGEIEVTPETWVFFGGSWTTHLEIGRHLHEEGEANLWQVHVSLKLDGPAYGGTGAENQVLVDRVFMVDASPCVADLDGNGMVNGSDLGQLLLRWGQPDPEADLDGDGIVTGSDIGLMLLAWGGCP